VRAAALVIVAACGGKAPPPAPPEPVHVATKVPVEDTEPEDNVSVVAKRGAMDESAIQAGLAPHTEEMSACYTSRVGKRRWLGGHIVVKWEVTAAGDIESVKLIDSDLGSHAIEKCLVDVARSASFGKPSGGPTDFTIPLDFALQGAKANLDVYDEDRGIAAVGAKQLVKLDSCGKGGETMPDDVTVTVYIGPRGAPLSVGFASARSEITEKWGDCAEKVVTAWRLPDPKGQVAKLAIRYRP
jgi:TonB family protein